MLRMFFAGTLQEWCACFILESKMFARIGRFIVVNFVGLALLTWLPQASADNHVEQLTLSPVESDCAMSYATSAGATPLVLGLLLLIALVAGAIWLFFFYAPVVKQSKQSLTIRVTLHGNSSQRFLKLAEQYGGAEQVFAGALRLLEIATEAKEGGAKVILRSADGTQEEEVLTVVDD